MRIWRPPNLTPADHKALDDLEVLIWDGTSLADEIAAAKEHNLATSRLTPCAVAPTIPATKKGRGK